VLFLMPERVVAVVVVVVLLLLPDCGCWSVSASTTQMGLNLSVLSCVV
jgi:hypothetical protein